LLGVSVLLRWQQECLLLSSGAEDDLPLQQPPSPLPVKQQDLPMQQQDEPCMA
jgi:hypothetical protein